MTGLYDAIAALPVIVDSVALERHEMDTSGDFTRVSTVVVLGGDGERGRGEDVTYDAPDHDALHAAHESDELAWSLTGAYTLDSLSTHLDDSSLFPEPPEHDASRHYRRWAIESAALDLALRQAGTDLASALDRTYDPVRFVVSTRLGEPPTADRVHEWLDIDPSLEFKLDPTPAWTDDLLDALAATDSVRVVDFKAFYEGMEVDGVTDPDLYRRVVEALPGVVVEDASYDDRTREALAGAEDRLSWDYPITGVESVRDLPIEPEWLNVKPSRFGTVESLLETIEYCLDHEIAMYGGGQYELAVGREHLHAIASLFYPDTPNDVAPSPYNAPEPTPDVPASPLAPPDDPVGLSWNGASSL